MATKENERVIVITGSASGLGLAIYKALKESNLAQLKADMSIPCHTGRLSCIRGLDIVDGPSTDYIVDVTDQEAVFTAAEDILSEVGEVDVVINCVGVNYLCPIEDLDIDDVDRLFRTNVFSVLFTTQAFLPQLKNSKGTIINVISNASHMPMTHSWAYNGTKGALEIITRQMARELTKMYGITVFGISPNKLAGTKMSEYIDNTFPPMRGLTYEEGRKYQLNGLLTGKETDPNAIAAILPGLLKSKSAHEFLSGCVLEMGL